MSGQKEKLWDLLEPIAGKYSLEIFDIEPPRGQGCLRVYVSRKRDTSMEVKAGAENSGATADIDDCSKVAREILDLEGLEEYMPGNTILEVSSPGVNRKLSREKHFADAVGERVRLVVVKDDNTKEVLRGTITSFDGALVTLKEENLGQDIALALGKIQEARVDFLF